MGKCNPRLTSILLMIFFLSVKKFVANSILEKVIDLKVQSSLFVSFFALLFGPIDVIELLCD